MTDRTVQIRRADPEHLDALLALDNNCFPEDRFSRRSLLHQIRSSSSIFLTAENGRELVGYGLLFLVKGTRLARLYSIAVAKPFRRRGVAQMLLDSLEIQASQQGRLYMRLDVRRDDAAAIALFASRRYRVFSHEPDSPGGCPAELRMQKLIRFPGGQTIFSAVPWFKQSTSFTCGPVALMMAMAAVKPDLPCNRDMELDIWREATTIFMTSGHGGCHPAGLALAAVRRGFSAEVFINRDGPLFVDGVRSSHKKEILKVVHEQFSQIGRASCRERV